MQLHHTFLGVLVLAGAAGAQGLDVAIVAAASGTSTNCRFTDPQAKLMATGFFNSVDIINVVLATPTLAELQAYDAILCWTNSSPVDHNAWGDVTADYVDSGGGVVVAVFANSTTSGGDRFLGGRWITGGYEVIIAQSGDTTGSASLGTVLDPGHPVMAGVASFSGGSSSFRPTATALTPGSTLIAEWDDGKVLVAEGMSPQRIDLGFYPPSSDCSPSFWGSTTDGAAMMAGALLYVAGGSEPGFAYCPGDGTGTACPCINDNNGSMGGCDWGNLAFPEGGVLTATGSASIASGTANLFATGIENNFGIFFGAANQVNGGNGIPLNDGLRCAGGALVRLIPPTIASGNQAITPSPIQTLDSGAASGVTRRYQYWFRTPNGPCGLMANLTNGYEITWTP